VIPQSFLKALFPVKQTIAIAKLKEEMIELIASSLITKQTVVMKKLIKFSDSSTFSQSYIKISIFLFGCANKKLTEID
jgi:hypothetical protein